MSHTSGREDSQKISSSYIWQWGEPCSKHLASKSRGSKALDEVEEDGEAAWPCHGALPPVQPQPPPPSHPQAFLPPSPAGPSASCPYAELCKAACVRAALGSGSTGSLTHRSLGNNTRTQLLGSFLPGSELARVCFALLSFYTLAGENPHPGCFVPGCGFFHYKYPSIA